MMPTVKPGSYKVICTDGTASSGHQRRAFVVETDKRI
jgi:hypothetical protein